MVLYQVEVDRDGAYDRLAPSGYGTYVMESSNG